MSNSNWTTFSYLLLKKRDNGTVRTENITKSNSNKRCSLSLSIHHLNDHLTDSLSCTHYICRIYSFISRYKNELLNAGLSSSFSCLISTHDIIFYCFIRAFFHQRNVFMRSCMEYNIRFILHHNSRNSMSITDRTD